MYIVASASMPDEKFETYEEACARAKSMLTLCSVTK